MRGRTKDENHTKNPISRSNRFHDFEEILIGGNVDLDLFSLFPQIYSTSMGGIESKESFFKVNNGGEREGGKKQHPKEGIRGPFIVPSKI
jgi:hypothetical protein